MLHFVISSLTSLIFLMINLFLFRFNHPLPVLLPLHYPYIKATSSRDMTVRVTKSTDMSCSYVLRGHHGPVTAVFFAGSDGSRLVTVSKGKDQTLRVWRVGGMGVIGWGKHGNCFKTPSEAEAARSPPAPTTKAGTDGKAATSGQKRGKGKGGKKTMTTAEAVAASSKAWAPFPGEQSVSVTRDGSTLMEAILPLDGFTAHCRSTPLGDRIIVGDVTGNVRLLHIMDRLAKVSLTC